MPPIVAYCVVSEPCNEMKLIFSFASSFISQSVASRDFSGTPVMVGTLWLVSICLCYAILKVFAELGFKLSSTHLIPSSEFYCLLLDDNN